MRPKPPFTEVVWLDQKGEGSVRKTERFASPEYEVLCGPSWVQIKQNGVGIRFIAVNRVIEVEWVPA